MPTFSPASGSAAAPPLQIATARLILRPWCEDDVDPLWAILVEPEVRRYLCDGEIVPRDFVVQQVRDSAERFATGSLGLWAGRHRDGGLCGFAGFMIVHERLELLFGVRTASFHTGLAREMAEAVIDFGFAHGLEVIVGSSDQPNVASQRLMERLGMQRTGGGPGAAGPQVHYELRRGGKRGAA